MNDRRRVVACTLVAVVVLGLLPPSVLAQQPAPPPAPASQPALVEVMPVEAPAGSRADVYDVGAGVLTVARMPFNATLCGLGALGGSVLFLLTFGSAYRATTRMVEEGCVHRWVLRGDDLRPHGAPGILPDRTSELYNRR